MSTHEGDSSPTRRRFIKSASIVSAATILTLPSDADARERRRRLGARTKSSRRNRKSRKRADIRPEPEPLPKDEIKPVKLGAVPTPIAFGAVVVPKSKLTFLTFPAAKLDDNGNYVHEGVGVLELTGCKEWRFRMPENADTTECEVVLDSLSECQTYEVHQSSWVAEHQSEDDLNRSEKLRHIVITFYGESEGVCSGGQYFEFLAEAIDVQVVKAASFDELVDYMSFLDSTAA